MNRILTANVEERGKVVLSGKLKNSQNLKAHNGFGVVNNVNKGGCLPRRDTPINNQKKIGLIKTLILTLMITQPFAFTASVVINATKQVPYQLDWNRVIEASISAIVSLIATYLYYKFKKDK